MREKSVLEHFIVRQNSNHPNLSKVDVRDFDEVNKWVSDLLKDSDEKKMILINCVGTTYNAFGHEQILMNGEM